MKKKNQCLFCNSTNCHTRIYTSDYKYDEVACGAHIKQLEKDADKRAPTNVSKTHITSTAKQYL